MVQALNSEYGDQKEYFLSLYEGRYADRRIPHAFMIQNLIA